MRGKNEQKKSIAINLHEFEHNSSFIDNVYMFFFLVFFSVFFCSLLAVVFFSFASEQQSDLLCKSAPKFSHSIFGIFFYFILFLCNICFYDAHFVSSKILPHVCTSVCVLSAYFIFHGEYPY